MDISAPACDLPKSSNPLEQDLSVQIANLPTQQHSPLYPDLERDFAVQAEEPDAHRKLDN